MSVPPPPNQWGSQPPTGGQPVGAQPWAPPPGGFPPGGPQQGWGAPPGPPPRRGGKGNWILAGIAVLAVIAVTVFITVLVVGKDSGSSPTPTNGNGSDFASANDKGPVGIITEEPTCAAWNRIGNGLSIPERDVGWGDREVSVPASAWTPQQRTMYETVGKAMRTTADQSVELARKTPHRVMRELYEQFVAYASTFADRVPTYKPNDSAFAAAADEMVTTLVNICKAITSGSAAAQAPLVPDTAAPTELSALGDPAAPQKFVSHSDSVCTEWLSVYPKFDADTAGWRQDADPNIPASQWTPEQKSASNAVVPLMTAFADKAEDLGRRSGNPTFEDFAVLSAQYRRAYVLALPTYTPADNDLVTTSTALANTIGHACEATGG
jgi:hypothetical protein